MKNPSIFIISLLSVTLLACSCNGQSSKNMKENHAYTNELIHESSPYLLQHAHNPVNWYPWGEKALQKAKDENKMLLISIGYAACHWCHVMEHQSFEDTAVAALMNRYYVCIKVDREERPDVDQVYMNAAYLISGSGGWPLNAFALPDGRPFYAGTYYPKEDWMSVLHYFADIHQNKPEMIKEQAEKVTEGIHASEIVPLQKDAELFTDKDFASIFSTWKPNIDFKKGGMNKAPKFPMPSQWEYLLQYFFHSKDKDALDAVNTTLQNMAYGGIYDAVGGGFSRYSVDAKWHVPHFEKMLYDNAQLVSLYAHAFQLTKNPLYKMVVYETLAFIEREMTDETGGFYASLDADSEGEEGKFYVWTKAEIDRILGDDADVFNDYYDVSAKGNWEHGNNILQHLKTDEAIARSHNISAEKLHTIIAEGKKNLLKTRSNRVRPGLDDKILTSWNALMLRGYCDAYAAFGEQKFLDAAVKNANFLLQNAIGSDDDMTRNFKNGNTTIVALLDDYAFTIAAFTDLYQVTFNEKWLLKAKELNDYTIAHFFDAASGMFFYSHNEHSNLIARKMEISDNVIPASNSEMARNLFRLGVYFDDNNYLEKSTQMLKNVQADLRKNTPYYSNWASLALSILHPPYEIAIVGSDFKTKLQEIHRHYLPNVLLMGGAAEGSLPLLDNKMVAGQTTIYVCRNKTCKRPVLKMEDAIAEMSE